MYVPFSCVRCPSCGSTFETGATVAPPDNRVEKTCSQTDQNFQFGALRKPASVLHTWKDISSFVGRGVRTVQRWEHDFGLPVHRPNQKERSAVFAFPEEINEWLHRTPVGLQPNEAILRSGKKAVQNGGRVLHRQSA